MAYVALQSVLHQVRRLTAAEGVGALSDAQLLQRVVETHDEAAFEVLVWRHGPLVLGTCRKLLHHEQDTEDAFQATFLVLARKAATIAKGGSLAGWLYQVACRIALRLRSQARRRQAREQHNLDISTVAAGPEDGAGIEQREWRSVVVEESYRLPDRYRGPIIACCLEGKTHAQAARELNRPLGSISSLLARGCELLRSRLRRRGAYLSTAALTALLADRASAVLSSSLVPNTVTAALKFSAGAAVSLPAVALADGMLRGLTLSKVKATIGLLLMLGVLAGGTAGLAVPASRQPDPVPEQGIEQPKPEDEKKARLDVHGDPLPEGALLRLGTIRFRHPGGVSAVAVSPDGKALVTGGSDTVRLWDTATGKPGPVVSWEGRGFGVGQNFLAFSPDGRKVFLPQKEGVAALDLSTGEAAIILPVGAETKVNAVHASPDGQLLATGTSQGVRVMELASGRIVWSTQNGPDVPSPQEKVDRLLYGPYSLAVFSPDGKLAAVNAGDVPKVLRLVDANTGAERRQFELSACLVRLAFSPDSRQVAVTERDNAVRLYDVATGQRLHDWTVKLTNPYENYTSGVAFSPDGLTLAVGATDHLIYLWDLRTKRALPPLHGHAWNVVGLVFAQDGRSLYSVGWDAGIRRWDPTTWRQVPVAENPGTGTVASSPVGSVLAWEGDDGVIHFSSAATGRKLRTVSGNPAGFSRLAFSPDGSILAAGGNDLSVQLWEVTSGKLLRQWSWPKGKDPHACVDEMAFSPDGKTLATVGFRTQEVVLWDVETGTRLGKAPHKSAHGAVFSSDSRVLVSAGWDRAVRWWSVPDLRPLDEVTLPRRDGKVRGSSRDPRFHSIAGSPDGRLLATRDLAGVIALWDAASHTLLHAFQAISGQCNVAFSPDGQWLAAGGSHGEVGLWEARTGQPVLKLTGHPAWVASVAFGSDGRTLLTGAQDGTGLVWDLRPKAKAQDDARPASLWDALAGTDAMAAYQAVWRLADQPDQSVPFLKEKLTPAKPIDRGRLKRLLDNLDSEKFAEREAASQELASLGEVAEPALRRELSQATSTEMRRRLQTLLDGLTGIPSSDDVRQTRAVVVLKWANTPEARQHLAELARGAPEARLTREAKSALRSLEQR